MAVRTWAGGPRRASGAARLRRRCGLGSSGPVELGGPKQRAVLALLMLEPGAVLPLDRLIDRMRADTPPPRAEVSVRGYVSNLRKALVAAGLCMAAITFRDRGYVLHVDAQAVDLHLFDRLVVDALELVTRASLALDHDPRARRCLRPGGVELIAR